MKVVLYLGIWVALLWLSPTGAAQQRTDGIDPEALIEQIVHVEEGQREQVRDIVFDVELLSGKHDKNKGFQEESRFVMKVFLKFQTDTTWFHQEFLEFYDKGKLQSPKKCAEKAKEKIEKDHKRKARNVSHPMLLPFYPESREFYDIKYEGVTEDKIDGYVCHHFTVHSKLEEDNYIHGDFFFEAEDFHLVRADFRPAKLTRSMMFKLKTLNMSIRYAPTDEGFWLPRQFDIQGKGKAAFLFGVNFAAIQYFRNPRINTNLSDEIFEANEDE
ncbi:MAG: hypothetical protein KOO62_07365 [candidate division Zixibacteria bacterium]|nr:hypothetical protein [candidate division Zixibacteria bacterium]